MTTSQNVPLLYTNPTPIDVKRHADMAIRQGLNLTFAAKTHAVPVNVIEFPQLCHHYPIVFSPDASATPAAVLGLVQGENLYVEGNGLWADPSAYIPSYIRRYPFLFAEIKDTDQLTLCVDDIPSVVDRASAMKLFNPDATPTALTNNALEFCKSFHAATLQSREFCAALEKSGILVGREADIPLPNGQKLKFGGFRMIDEAKFAALPDATYLEWRKKGWVGACYAAMMSGAHWNRLAQLYVKRNPTKAA